MENRPMMYIALSYDHRIVDGSEAVRFLVKIKNMLEDPESLLLEGRNEKRHDSKQYTKIN